MWALNEWEGYVLCEEFNCLPFSGGLFEQPARKVEIMKIIRNIINECKARKLEAQEMELRGKEMIYGNGKGNNNIRGR